MIQNSKQLILELSIIFQSNQNMMFSIAHMGKHLQNISQKVNWVESTMCTNARNLIYISFSLRNEVFSLQALYSTGYIKM